MQQRAWESFCLLMRWLYPKGGVGGGEFGGHGWTIGSALGIVLLLLALGVSMVFLDMVV